MIGVDDALCVTLRPHCERSGAHTERFDAYLGDQLICTSRSGWHDPARALLALGYDPETLLVVQHAGKLTDSTIVPKMLGELAEWTYIDSDHDGIRKIRWLPPEERFKGLRTAQHGV